jgi:hypothetical protein
VRLQNLIDFYSAQLLGRQQMAGFDIGKRLCW